ncbi:hypothetical protein ACLOJK_018940 [Asimina triloba]
MGKEVVGDFKVIRAKDHHQEVCGARSLGESSRILGQNEIERLTAGGATVAGRGAPGQHPPRHGSHYP